MIRDRAYEIWDEGGRHDGRADEHWQQAVHEIATREHAAKPPVSAKTAGIAEGDETKKIKAPKEKSAKPVGAETVAKKAPKSKAGGKAKSGEPKPRAKK